MSLKELMNEETRQTLAVMVGAITEKEDKTGAPYVMVDLLDGESVVTARIFKTSKDTAGFKTGDIIEAAIVSSLYNGNMGYIANNYSVPDQNLYQKSDFIISAPMSFAEMWAEFESFLLQIQNLQLRQAVTNQFNKNKERLEYWPAAKTMHHNYYGGLLYHTLCVTRNAVALANNYPEVSKDIVIATALLHDIGKIPEFTVSELGVVEEYSTLGCLLGHLYMGAETFKAEAKQCGVSTEITMMVLHGIVSHHDNPEWGAIKKPATMEARIVATADMADAQLSMMRQSNSASEPTTMGEKFIDGAKIYHPSYI